MHYLHLLIKLTFCLCFLVLPTLSHAAWFSASGQAVIINGDRKSAREEATQEAIKQALLFAGASVTSVQQMTNGLLMDERLEIRASGEVNMIQLVDEVYENGIVTVTIRADIFAQDTQCSAADYTKKISTTYFPIRFEAQAADGQIQALGKNVALEFQTMVGQLTPSLQVSHIEPYVFDWFASNQSIQAQSLANKTNTQYVLSMVIDDVSVQRPKSMGYNPFKKQQSTRNFNFTMILLNGPNGEELIRRSYSSVSPWEFGHQQSIDVASQMFWRSQYGRNIKKTLQTAISDLEEFAICQPTMGRVIAVANNQLQINLGRSHQVQTGDQLTLFNVKQITDTFGQEYRQFVLHPTRLIVRQVYSDTATVEAADRGLLGNVQPNDFVSRQ